MAWPLPLVLGFSSVGSMAYVYYGVLKLPRGLTRLAATIPLIAFYMYMAPTFDTVFVRGLYSFFFVWLTSFKLALLCWDEGPAADPWAVASFPRFIAVMNLSLHLKRQKFSEREKVYIVTATKLSLKRKPSNEMVNGISGEVIMDQVASVTRRTRIVDSPTNMSTANNGDDVKSSRKHEYSWVEIFSESMAWQMVWLRLFVKFVALGCVCYLYTFRESIPPMVLYFVYCWHMYIICSLMFEGIAAAVSPLLGIELEAAYDKPFLAHSLTNFWGKRWNILISDLLRVSVYDPILLLCSGSGERSVTKSTDSAKPTNGVHDIAAASSNGSAHSKDGRISHLSANPPLWARSIGMFSCFLVSGLMHELIFYYMNQTKPTWEGTAFFALNGAATLVELAIRKKTQLRFPKIVSVPLTLTFLFVTAIWLFFPALCGPGTDTKAIAEFQHFFGQVYLVLWGS